ncbi:tyrosine-protein phosphatase [Streptomyces sp. NPDC101150]|uniref:tyrosine-protein phosphatase n=1 Tax=Streptomyces sp. NPDC101150 TaxID=3366114 RepID=UPI0038028E28
MFPTRRRATTLLFGSALTLGGLSVTAACGRAARAPSEASDAHAKAAAPAPVRRIALQGAVNVRDLGGYRTADGREVRYGRLFRSGSLAKLTPADLRTLAGLHLHTVVDLRVPAELRFDGRDRLPHGLAVTSRPVDDTGLFEAMQSAVATRDPAEQQKRLGGGRAEHRMREIYPGFVSNARNREQFAATLEDIARDGRLPMLFHCTSGKDRTGWLSYVLLRLLGVPHAAAERDYLLSNTIRRPADAKVNAGLKKAGMMRDTDLLRPLQEVRTSYLDAGLGELRQEYGSVGRYVSKGLGLDGKTVGRVRAHLLR